MFENQPPPDLQWVDIFLSAIAFLVGIVTLPTAFQMWWGKPKPRFSFEKLRVDGGAGLICAISNAPVKNKILKFFGVRRSVAQDFGGSATIKRTGSREFVAQKTLKIKGREQEPCARVDLHPGIGTFALILGQEQGEPHGKFTRGNDGEEVILIEPGEYECELRVTWGQDSATARRTFMVGTKLDKTHWRPATDG